MRDIEQALSLLAGTKAPDRTFFDVAAEALALAIGCRWAGIVERAPDAHTMRFLAFRMDGETHHPGNYDVEGTPTEQLYGTRGRDLHYFIADKLTERFPRIKKLARGEVASCRGELFLNTRGEPAGHVFVMDDSPASDDAEVRTFFRLVSQRVGAEYNRLASERALAASEAKFRSLVEGSIQGIAVHRDWRILFANDAYARILGHDDAEAVTGIDIRDFESPAERARLEHYAENRRRGRPVPDRYEMTAIRRDGRQVALDCAVRAIDWEGDPAIQVVVSDITAEMDARIQLSDAIESLADGVVIFDSDDRLVVCNEHYRETNELISNLLVPGTPFVELARAAADSGLLTNVRGREDAWLRERLDLHEQGQGLMEERLADGRWLQIAERKTENGYTIGILTDITDLKLREEQLRQVQKMEAVGQLTGGIAHDFNNLLAIIQGNIGHLDRKLGSDNPLKELTAPALRAAERGAALTSRLLAFSRRQSLDVQEVEVEALLLEMQDLLHRSLGKSVRLEHLPVTGLWPCLADPAQLEQAVLNLAINARDAMAEGGVLVIETANAVLRDADAAAEAGVAPGDYVAITVTDSGSGMRPEVMERIFEPFFTTKEVGKGTGLGLSMVFGFARQSKGNLTVYSELGLGSTFRLYLPRASRPAAEDAPDTAPPQLPVGRGETVLVVEDNADVRRMAVMLLEEFGYRVRQADSGGAALRNCENEGPIDLLFTDVVLPGGMSGPRLAELARRQNPELKVLFMTGQIGEGPATPEDPAVDAPLLQKPFEPDDLAFAVAGLLAGD
ncbi:MAG: PAS-domain containing protein [Alphaproteobacteria bacterium]|jgi:PAS domain S-box-containing protein|nr:PAS-domain containing protein [Alphaproteobacteria bacterium]